MTLPKSLTTITPFSKILAAILYITLPFAGFYLGMEYQKSIIAPIDSNNIQPSGSTEPGNKNFSCDRTKNEIEQNLINSNYCKVDSDCEPILLGGQYIEFGCYHYINKQVDKQKIYDQMDEYHSRCSQIINDCSLAPKADCVAGKCVEYYISCGCGCCGFSQPLEKIAKTECLYRSKGEYIQGKIDRDQGLSPEMCATAGCSYPIKYVYCD